MHSAGARTPLLAGVVVSVILAGCADDPHVGSSEQAATVESVIGDGCSTSILMPLSEQIVEEMSCMAPGHFATLTEQPGIEFSGSAVIGLITADGKQDLLAAVAARGGTLRINSGFRTVAQQYLLYRWYQAGRCGITAAATPGRSNHESGRALDIGNYGDWRATLEAYGWYQTVPGDPVHFDHTASGDSRGMDVHAFQRLWNRNNPGDSIDEDGIYGPQTAARLSRAPIEGFAISGCDQPEPEPEPGDPEDPVAPEDPTDPSQPDGPFDQGEPIDDGPDDLTGGCETGTGGTAPGLALLLAAIGLVSLRTSRGGRRRR